ncbi:hypothetical protein WJX74_003553 [Apatococcus lobatus]|uniref:Histone-binding protein RBBP4-like N-terminal domain-containing protein n=1 Tax=Apatococcus lobatus TaxID=904363 RepID=A0AAW1S376_9CHLO
MEDQPESDEARLFKEEYQIWKKNTPFLYDLLITQELIWPSLTAQWLPGRQVNGFHATQKLLLGTNTEGAESDYLLVYEVSGPASSNPAAAEQSSASGKAAADDAPPAAVRPVQRIKHNTAVNRARAMPQNSSIVATKPEAAEVYVFDCTKHPAGLDTAAGTEADEQNGAGAASPEHTLRGHTEPGFAVGWSPHTQGHLLSGATDGLICMWDLNAGHQTLDAQHVFREHREPVGDVAWHPVQSARFGSVGDDKRLVLWDMRTAGAVQSQQVHESDILCLDFSPFNEHIVATGSKDTTVLLHDLRNLQKPLHRFAHHSDEVLQVSWSPTSETLLASGGNDRRLFLWDLNRIGDEQAAEDAEDGPPELLFMHTGHTGEVSDFSWNAEDEWVMASVDSSNYLQVWQVARNIYEDDYRS